MSGNKVSIGLRGWRFDEDEVFTEDGEYRDFAEMDDDVRNRLVRLSVVVEETCDACWLETDDPDERNQVEYVYGEPLSEVLVCEPHEPDFVYWFRERGGDRYAGIDEFDDRFHEWFLEGGRAPDWYDGMEYVAGGEDLPSPPTPDPEYLEGHVAEGKPEQRIDLREGTVETFPEERDRSTTTVDDDIDLSTDYPTS